MSEPIYNQGLWSLAGLYVFLIANDLDDFVSIENIGVHCSRCGVHFEIGTPGAMRDFMKHLSAGGDCHK